MTRPTLLFTHDRTALGLSADGLLRGVRSGELVRVSRGAFADAEQWAATSDHDRYVLRITAVAARLAPDTVFSHESAAALWGFPVLDAWPHHVHCLDPTRQTGKRTASLVRHPATSTGQEPPSGPAGVFVTGGGLKVTSAAVTALDVGLTHGFTAATMMFDHGLRNNLMTLDEIPELLARRPRARRRREVAAALRIASPLSESPGESISKAEATLLGFPRAILQQRFDHSDGKHYFCDFFWREYGLIGEFDGAEKYLSESMRSGLSIDQVILREKWRDENLLAQPGVARVVHWNYATARDPARLASVLERAGLPRNARRLW